MIRLCITGNGKAKDITRLTVQEKRKNTCISEEKSLFLHALTFPALEEGILGLRALI